LWREISRRSRGKGTLAQSRTAAAASLEASPGWGGYNLVSMRPSRSQIATGRTVALAPHPTTPSPAVQAIEVEVCGAGGTSIQLHYELTGDIAGLLIPAGDTPRCSDKLWEHTCFEAFVAGQGDGGNYFEFNFAPSTEWAAYAFTGYRQGMKVLEAAQPPRISVSHDADRLSLDAVIDFEPLPLLRNSPILRLALSAVVEDVEHRKSYWALAHPPGKADFHHADGFSLTLTPASPVRGEGAPE
jgi:hypothetical protein